jgi:hypothetical protein
MALLNLTLQEIILNGNKKKMPSMPPTKRARITEWLPHTLANIKALLGVVREMSLHPMSAITDYLSEAWMK